jgi:tetratricopeptide (TPR) repeat protein
VCYRHAIELNPKYAAAYFNLGALLHLKDKIPEAMRHCRKAL